MHDRKLSVIGLGYVGLPLAVAFAKCGSVVAFDVSQKRIDELKCLFDRTEEVSSDDLRTEGLCLTTRSSDLQKADFHIIEIGRASCRERV